MTKALLEGDETAAQQITRQLMSNGTTATAFISSVLVPPLVYLGQAWHDGELEIYVEHRASAMVERILGSLSPNPRGAVAEQLWSLHRVESTTRYQRRWPQQHSAKTCGSTPPGC